MFYKKKLENDNSFCKYILIIKKYCIHNPNKKTLILNKGTV